MKELAKFIGGLVIGVTAVIAVYAVAETINWKDNSLYVGTIVPDTVLMDKDGGLLRLDVGTITPAGTDNTDATSIVDQITYAEGDATAGVILPASTGTGAIYVVHNLDATSLLKVYPDASGQINGGTATTGSVNVAAEETAFFIDVATNTWYGGVAVDF